MKMIANNIAGHLLKESRQKPAYTMARDATLLAGSQYLAAGIGFMTNVVAARMLGATDYGIVAIVMAYPMLLWSFIGVKSVSVTTRYIASFRSTQRNEELLSICKMGYGLDFFVSVIAFLLVGLTGSLVARTILINDTPGISWLMMAYAASFPLFSLNGTSWAILSSCQRFRWLATLQILDKGITLLLVVSLLWFGYGISGVIVGTALGHAAHGLMMMGVATGVLSNDKIGLWWKASISNVSALRRELAHFFSWNFLNLTMSGLMGQVPQLLLGCFRGPEEAGFFRLAASFITAGSYLENSLGKVSYPILAAKREIGDRDKLNRTLKHWTLQMGLPACFLISITIPLLSMLIPEIIGYSYSPMVIGTQIMMIGTAASAPFFWLNSYYYAVGMVEQWTKFYSLYAALSIGLGFLAIYGWGFMGVGVVTGVGKVIFTGVMVGLFVMNRERSRESFRLSESR